MNKLKAIHKTYIASLLATVLFIFIVIIILQINKGEVLEIKGIFKKEKDIFFSFEIENYKANDIDINEQFFLRDDEINTLYEAVVIKVVKIEYENLTNRIICDLRVSCDEYVEVGKEKTMRLIKSHSGIIDKFLHQ
ncbi:hypothetical protein E5329_25070 [Petralouisia muris]|uniref:Uncharacterized protein n=1 Tax=Petralouisia muris TaxID=3032872 RepID=A0AC61RP65_9FIRM|nr:hypothetical protein [Petralouisia muris]TGY89441.1 hypothetical protein E5329_25070 [Petralouisia muris]